MASSSPRSGSARSGSGRSGSGRSGASGSGRSGVFRPKKVDPTPVSVLSTATGARVDLVGASAADPVVTGVTLRAQDVSAGDLFAALPGARVHGASFADQAVAAGASAILTDPAGRREIAASLPADASCAVLVHPDPRQVLGAVSARIYGYPSQRLKLIGITGTSGKTTTAYMVEAAMLAAGHSVGLIGTVETRIDGTAVPSTLTTPEAPTLQAMLATMLERGVDAVVMEVSSHALALGRVDGVSFAVGAFTNLSQDHLDFHDSMQSYFEAKARLFAPAAPTHAVRSVICVDDEWGRRMMEVTRAGLPAREQNSRRPAVTVSTGPVPGQWSAGPSRVGADGVQEVTVTGPEGVEHQVSVRLPGRYNVANAVLAGAVAITAGAPAGVAFEAIGSVSVPGRLERVDRGQEFLAVVDYAHKPAAVEAVLQTLRAQTTGRIAVVLGAGGDRDSGKRVHMGAAAACGADLVIITDDNPRTEDPAAIRAAVLTGATTVSAADRPQGAEEIREIGARDAAIEAAVAWARPGDVVLVAGKGHETGQEVDGVKHPFDDRMVLGETIDSIHGGEPPQSDTTTEGEQLTSSSTTSSPQALTVLHGGEHAGPDEIRTLLRKAAQLRVEASLPGARTWAVLGAMTLEDGIDDNARALEHDLIGRQIVRLAIDKTLCVGPGRAVRALHQGTIMEGSWGDEVILVEDPEQLSTLMGPGGAWLPGGGDIVVIAGAIDHDLPTLWREAVGHDVVAHGHTDRDGSGGQPMSGEQQ